MAKKDIVDELEQEMRDEQVQEHQKLTAERCGIGGGPIMPNRDTLVKIAQRADSGLYFNETDNEFKAVLGDIAYMIQKAGILPKKMK